MAKAVYYEKSHFKHSNGNKFFVSVESSTYKLTIAFELWVHPYGSHVSTDLGHHCVLNSGKSPFMKKKILFLIKCPKEINVLVIYLKGYE